MPIAIETQRFEEAIFIYNYEEKALNKANLTSINT